MSQLAQYIQPALLAGSAAVYCCWYGDWEHAPVSTRHVTPEHFGGSDFHFVERELLMVSSQNGD